MSIPPPPPPPPISGIEHAFFSVPKRNICFEESEASKCFFCAEWAVPFKSLYIINPLIRST